MRISRCAGQMFRGYGISLHPTPTRIALRNQSSITITPANQSPKLQEHISDISPQYVTPPETLISHLDKYSKWFPNDSWTNAQIQSFKILVRGEATSTQAGQTINIGILYADEHTKKSSKVIESLLADPLSHGNETWFRPITTRSSTELNRFKLVGDATENEGDVKNLYKVNSPILSPVYRPSYSESLDSSNPRYSNSIEFWELNSLSGTEIDDVHFIINVVSEIDQILKIRYPAQIQEKILLNVIDNMEYSPPSTESTPVKFVTSNMPRHTIKINSQLVYQGIQKFLELDTKAATEFLNSIQHSNIFELQKAICWYSRSNNLSQWLLESIRENIEVIDVRPQALANTTKMIKNEDVVQFSQSAHTELQDILIPETTKLFTKNLNWWKLYYKNDNVEYDLKDFFNKAFMNQSIEKYSYVRGQISAKLKTDDFRVSTEFRPDPNPLLELKSDIINERITHELQPFVYRILGSAFTIYQLPISVIGFLGYQYFDLSLNAALAIGLLGWVVGFNHVSKSWTRLTSDWSQALFEEVRLCVGKDCVEHGLLQEVTKKYEDELKLSNIRREVLDGILKATSANV